jgi:predicted molibdopterin-dependent oxidoreductase YjgC
VRLGRRVAPEGSTLESWRIPIELAARWGVDLDLETVEEVQDEIARVAPGYVGIDARLLRRALDGVVVPLADHADEVTVGPGAPGAGPSWDPIPPRPDPGADTPPVAAEPNGDGTTAPAPAVDAPPPPVALHEWAADATPPAGEPVDAYALRLVAGHLLYGADPVVVASPPIATLLREPALGLNPRDVSRLGVAVGDRVRVTAARGSIELPVAIDDAVPAGTAFIAANLEGPGAGDLIDIDAPVTDLRVETIT